VTGVRISLMDASDLDLRKDYLDAFYSRHNNLDPGDYRFYERYYSALIGRDLPEDKTKRLLEIGCGVGYLTHALEARGYSNITAVDIDKGQVEICRQVARAEVVCEEALDYLTSSKTSSYSVIIMFDVLEHIPKKTLLPFCREALRTLEEGGLLIARVPNMNNLFAPSTRYIDITHEVGFTESSLHQLLHLAGFVDIQHRNANPMLKKLSRLREALNSYLHRIVRRIVMGGIPGPEVYSFNLLTLARKPGS
jgi:2-polyprenyl-3-methyl-5-hydroxy-6-metoxy-1,4-benzoquinol methylase